MKTIMINKAYGLDNVTIGEAEKPNIQANDVLVKVEAISLNQLDLMIAKGAFGNALPHVLGSDAVGRVVEVGKDTTQFKVGDLVSTHFIQSWQSGNLEADYLVDRLGTDVQGVFAEYIALPESSLVKIPSNLTSEEAAALPIAGLTAWEALVNLGQIKAGQTVLLQGTGGVSIFALQFAKALGAKVIITSGSDDKLKKAKALGADETINYKTTENWQDKVLELTGGKGVDLALEISWAEVNKTIQAIKLGGKISVVGLLGGADANVNIFGIIQKNISITGVNVGPKTSFQAMNRTIEQHNIKPVIDKVFYLSEAAEALKYFETASHFGKVVVKI